MQVPYKRKSKETKINMVIRYQLSAKPLKTSSLLPQTGFAHLTMEPYDLLVINGLVVTASDTGHYDIAIKHEKIALLASKGSLAGIAAKRVIDGEGGYVMVCGAFPSTDENAMLI